jgi:hypothetical protein
MPYLIAILLAPLVIVLLYGFALFDRLLRAEYEQHRPVWEKNGKPAGFFWHARECSVITSHLARIRLSFAWLFWTPLWITDSPLLVTMLRRYRFAVLVWNIGIVAWFVIFLGVLT